jgi:hypothetical protein
MQDGVDLRRPPSDLWFLLVQMVLAGSHGNPSNPSYGMRFSIRDTMTGKIRNLLRGGDIADEALWPWPLSYQFLWRPPF